MKWLWEGWRCAPCGGGRTHRATQRVPDPFPRRQGAASPPAHAPRSWGAARASPRQHRVPKFEHCVRVGTRLQRPLQPGYALGCHCGPLPPKFQLIIAQRARGAPTETNGLIVLLLCLLKLVVCVNLLLDAHNNRSTRRKQEGEHGRRSVTNGAPRRACPALPGAAPPPRSSGTSGAAAFSLALSAPSWTQAHDDSTTDRGWWQLGGVRWRVARWRQWMTSYL